MNTSILKYNMIAIALLLMITMGCDKKPTQKEATTESVSQPKAVEVAQFKGAQVTGVTVSQNGRMFANFPRWRPGVPHSVVEVNPEEGTYQPYPNQDMNTWELGMPLGDSVFVAIQSVVAFEQTLYVLDTRNPLFKGVKGQPRIFAFDLSTNQLQQVYIIGEQAFKPNSYVNDLRVDKKRNRIYMTDSGEAGLIVLDMATGQTRRILDGHPATKAEQNHLLIDGKKWENTVHADGIAFDANHDQLYFHSLTGYHLYTIDAAVLDSPDSLIETAVKKVKKTTAPDGMIFGPKGYLYYADLEHHAIMRLSLEDGKEDILIAGEPVKWADTFSVYDGSLYYTNSRIHESTGDIAELTYTIYKIAL